LLTSSEIQLLFRKIGFTIEIGIIKALLKQLGFSWNGKACSLMSLFQKCNDFIEGRDIQSPALTPINRNIAFDSVKKTQDELVRKIKDLLYASKKTMYELFQEAKTGSGVDAQGMIKLVQRISSNTVSEE
jgi:hypothetical protein